jgi:hypothetical protein
MEAIVQQFFNLAIMEQALPLILSGLEQTILLCLIVTSAWGTAGAPSAVPSCRFTRSEDGAPWAAIAGNDLFVQFRPLVLLILIYAGLRLPASEDPHGRLWPAAANSPSFPPTIPPLAITRAPSLTATPGHSTSSHGLARQWRLHDAALAPARSRRIPQTVGLRRRRPTRTAAALTGSPQILLRPLIPRVRRNPVA